MLVFIGFVGIIFVITLMIIGYVYRTRSYASPKPYILDFIETPSLGPYYMDLEHKLTSYAFRDAHGGILEIYKQTGQPYFHPIRNTHYALALYARYLKNSDENDKVEFLQISKAIIANGVRLGNGARVWYYPLSYFRGQKTPWISAMAQGQVIAVMARAYECTHDETFIDVAREAFVPFLNRIADGGVCSDNDSLGIFYEEYAHEEIHYQHHTLNGMLSSLFGLYDYWKLTGDSEVKHAFENGVTTIKRNLMSYDLPYCSTYDLRHVIADVPLLCSAHYNAVHVAHLRILATMTGDTYFSGVADCWNRKLEDQVNRLRLTISILKWRGYHAFVRLMKGS